jgi:septal ring factor EnvC (AmiA/AmiB activator)
MSELPQEGERLLAVAPDRFVAERKELAKQLREDGRPDEAKIVEALRKPSAVVLAVNRSARDRPKAAQQAAAAAERVREAQVAGDGDAFRSAVRELESALDLLADVALAQLSPPGKTASDAMRRRVHDLLRSAVADDDARDALARGVLQEEVEAPGFSPFAGMAFAAPEPTSASKRVSASERREAEKRERLAKLRDELRAAEADLKNATRAARDAERARARAEDTVKSARKKLERAEKG